MGSPILFFILAFVAVAAAFGMLLSKNAVHSALFLVLNFTAVGVFYIVLAAPFIAMVQITVYAGAIMVLFLFVIMLLGAEKLDGVSMFRGGWQGWLAPLLGILLLIGFASALMSGDGGSADVPPIDAGPAQIGKTLFQSYVFPFEVTSILLLVAMISLVVWQTQKKKSKE